MGSVSKQEQMSRMKKVETAICEANAQPLGAPFFALFLPVSDACRWRGRGRVGDHFARTDNCRPGFADGNTSSEIGKAHRIGKRKTASCGRGERRHNRVTRP